VTVREFALVVWVAAGFVCALFLLGYFAVDLVRAIL
jgi:hypothetical protein